MSGQDLNRPAGQGRPALPPRTPAVMIRRREATGIGLIFLPLALMPFVQLGYTYWVSAGLVATLLATWASRGRIAAGFWPGRAIFPVIMLMYVPLAYSSGGEILIDGLRTSREAVILALMYCASVASGAPARIEIMRPREFRRIELVAMIVAFGMLALMLIQVIALARGRYIGMPQDWYVINGGTLPSELDLKWSKLRPSGTFGEPSYLGFVMLSIIVMLSPLMLRSRRTQIILATCLTCGLLSRSASFLLGSMLILILIVVAGAEDSREKATRGALGGLAVIAAGLSAYFSGALDRFTSGDGVDDSTQLRIITPLRILPDYLMEHPFGLPISRLLGELRFYVLGFLDPLPTDNALANLFFQYGLLTAALIVLMIIMVQRSWVLRAYVMCSMMFNGGFLTIDKLAMFLVVLIVYDTTTQLAAQAPGGRRLPLVRRPRLPLRSGHPAGH